ncbi:TetR/AcrR family transcriptional regulator [Streptomyces sp. AM2-3-1]|uniref:TetR/AcrR family transcriptional regulator n=1 Tax=Streptomyces sp. AM2-3-1 TaxID=3075824 RepID=UPI0028C4EEC7|nr:TetR/AcrR family transcriptional regulator [Streptomyces sp. AM2-3-1]WNO62334.1 TetR/AcrR family transcriptional regulator [Streptomyces sp. AM2-3-1]WNO69612.1 TetR/AcrR family transcriptional regulator [Streptomyces sp. AM2-3-1]
MTTTRKYNSPRRANSAAATREAILSSAHALFLARGYAGVTIGEIAEAGKVAVPTVYSSVGNKPGILTALLKPALTDPAIASTLAAVEASDNPRTVIELTAEGTRLTHERHWELVYGLFYRNPPGEPAVKAVLDRGADDYVQALTRVADRLVVLDALRAEVSRAKAIDLLLFYLGPHAWITLVGERAWPFDRAQTWIAHSACQALLKDL